MQAGSEERFVGVDVAYAGNTPLIEQERLERRPAPGHERAQHLRREGLVERFHA